jgi:predicted TIM-barrel fold metal-dependent hydrolase
VTAGLPARGLIDVHAHFLPPSYRRAIERAGAEHPDGIAHWPSWDAEAATELMDSLGIASAVLSVSTPGLLVGGGTDPVALAREVNEEGVALARGAPGRFGCFASLPLPDVDAAAAEAARALDTLGADGVVVMTNYDGLYLGDRRLDPLFEVLDARGAVVFVHPTSPVCGAATSLGRPRPLLEFFFDTTRAVANYLLNSGPQRFPAVEMVVPHAGAALPVLFDRVTGFVARGATRAEATVDDLHAGLARLWFDLAGHAAHQQSFAIRRLAGVDRLLYGSDYPFTSAAQVARNLDDLRNASALGTEELGTGLRRNALRLLPRFGADA